MHITINAIPPSLNKFAGRANTWEYRELKKHWKDLVAGACVPRPAKPAAKATVTLTYYFPDKRRRDPDNFAGKMVLDGLTAAEVIQDDSFECIELVLRGAYDKARPRTEITVHDKEASE